LNAANPAIADEQTKQSINLGEVEVTANKISENLKDVPQSISVVSDTELQEREVKNVEELVKTMPNITGVGGMYEGISTRGLNPSIYNGIWAARKIRSKTLNFAVAPLCSQRA